jgi:hypothetical protein
VKAWFRRARPLIAAITTVAAVAACDETLEGGVACPSLCPEKPSTVQVIDLDAVEFDTAIGGFPTTGTETHLLLAKLGDTLDARAVIRYDSLPATFRHNNSVVDSNIVSLDSAMIKLRLFAADTLGPDVTVELYDVDVTAGDDTSAAVLLPNFEPSRFCGSRTFTAAELKDSLRIPLDTAKLLAKINAEPQFRRLRLGILITSPSAAQLRVYGTNATSGGFSPLLYFKPSPDSTVAAVQLGTFSKTPELPSVASDVADFQLIAVAPPAEPANVLRIGGVPGKRGYLRFNIPSNILDSSTIVRATLELTQRPNPEGPAAGDSGAVQPHVIAAGTALTDLNRVLQFISSGFDSTRLVPRDSGARFFEVVTLVRSWRFTSAAKTPRAIALRSTTEGSLPWQVDFFSIESVPAVRPRLRITYVPLPAPGLP